MARPVPGGVCLPWLLGHPVGSDSFRAHPAIEPNPLRRPWRRRSAPATASPPPTATPWRGVSSPRHVPKLKTHPAIKAIASTLAALSSQTFERAPFWTGAAAKSSAGHRVCQRRASNSPKRRPQTTVSMAGFSTPSPLASSSALVARALCVLLVQVHACFCCWGVVPAAASALEAYPGQQSGRRPSAHAPV